MRAAFLALAPCRFVIRVEPFLLGGTRWRRSIQAPTIRHQPFRRRTSMMARLRAALRHRLQEQWRRERNLYPVGDSNFTLVRRLFRRGS